MKRFVTPEKVFAEVHGGAFLWESFRYSLTLDDGGEVAYRREPWGAQPSQPFELIGRVVESGRTSWMEIHIPTKFEGKKLVIYAREVGTQLICSTFSELTGQSSCELFHREEGAPSA